MTLILSGTNGLSEVDGSAATPAIRGTDANTGIFFPAADQVAITTGGTQRAVVDASGNVGIGTTSPSKLLQVTNPDRTVSSAQVLLEGSYNAYGTGISFQSRTSAGGTLVEMARIVSDGEDNWNTTASTQDAGLRFYTTSDGTSAEKMRINSSGNVGIGYSTPTVKLEISDSTAEVVATQIRALGGTAANRIARLSLVSSGNYTWAVDGGNDSMRFTQDGTERMRLNTNNGFVLNAVRLLISGASGIPAPVNNGDGNVGTTAAGGLNIIGKGSSTDILFLNKNGGTAGSVATGATTITTSSDERLKENLQPITGALDIVCQMRHETGNYKSDPSRTVAFLIAQDVDKLFPYAVEKADPDSWGVNYNWITPLHGAAIAELTALVKEQQAIITQLQADVAALKGTP